MANTAIIDFIFNSQGAMKGISEFQSKLSKSIDAIINSTAGKMGALGTALIGFSSIKSMLSEVKEVADFSTVYGKNIEAISKFNNLMAQFGGSTQDSLKVYGQLQDALTELRTNASGAYKQLATKLKIDFWDETTGKFKDSAQILAGLRKNWHSLSEEGKQDALRTLGINLPHVRRYLEASTEEMREAINLANKMPKLNEKSVKSLQRFERSWAIIKASFIQVGGVILEGLAKPLEYVGKLAEWLSQQSEEVRTSIVGLVAGFGALAPILSVLRFLASGVMFVFKAIGFVAVNAFGATLTLLTKIGALFTRLLVMLAANPIAAIALAIAGLVYLIYDNWDGIKAYFQEFISWISGLAGRLSGIFEDVFHNLLEWIKNILSKIPVIGKMINDELKDQDADVELKSGFRESVLNRDKMIPNMTMIPRGTMASNMTTTNNNQRTNTNNTFYINYNGGNQAEQEQFTSLVRQSTNGNWN